MSNTSPSSYRPLSESEIQTLRSGGCTADDWRRVQVREPFLVDRVVDAHFVGDVLIGSLSGNLPTAEGVAKPAGIYRAELIDCQLGDRVRIAGVSGHIAHYRIGNDVLLEGLGRVACRPGARFGNGVEIEVLNEAGGREVVLLNSLSSQLAYLMCVYRHDERLISQLQQMAHAAAASATADYGTIGDGARITETTKIVDVAIGPAATVDGSIALVNGTILSHPQAPTTIGAGVIAEDFIVAEGASITDAAMLTSSFVGQGSRVGKQFSAEGSLFFANCEAFHGEACSIFAGPYTVTHHKSSLLIGGMFSFFNAGSGTNQSNHRYKLGPSHEGKLERGCKTGSSSYLMWPCRVGPFSVVLGKHTRVFDTRDMPFSHVEADSSGRCTLVPGLYIATVGTLRDGRKWPSRDRRGGGPRRDLISFPVFNPLTVGRMIRGAQRLGELAALTDRSKETAIIDGAEIKRVLLRSGKKRYLAQAELYLRGRIVNRLTAYPGDDLGTMLGQVLAAPAQGTYSSKWIDVGGLLLPQLRLNELLERIRAGTIADVDQLHEKLASCAKRYEDDEWMWVRQQAHKLLGLDLDQPDRAALLKLVDDYGTAQQKFLQLILIDAEREYDQASRIGYGLDGDEDEAARDFAAVRGEFSSNSFVQDVRADIAAVQSSCDALRIRLGADTTRAADS
jgi:hypothetical protein